MVSVPLLNDYNEQLKTNTLILTGSKFHTTIHVTRRHTSTGILAFKTFSFSTGIDISYLLIVSDLPEGTKRSLEPNRRKRSRDERSTSHKHLEVAMVADDLVVKAHGEENLKMYLLILAHVVKKLHDWNYR